jgi:hypothetical protein
MKWLVVALLLATVTRRLSAQGGYEVEVYKSAVLAPRMLMIETHTSYIFRGPLPSALGTTEPPDDDLRGTGRVRFDPVCNDSSTPYFSRAAVGVSAALARSTPSYAPFGCGINPTITGDHVLHETVEATLALSHWAEVAVYAFGSKVGGSAVTWVGSTGRVKLQVPASWRWAVGVAVSNEIEYERSTNSIASWTWELRPIVDKTAGRWYFAFNPVIARQVHGPGVNTGVQFAPSGRMTFDVSPKVTAGAEYFGAWGRIGAFAVPSSRLQQLYAVADLHLSPLWEISAGVGAGLTPATSQLAAKLVLGRALTW